MAGIERIEIHMVDLKPKTRRTDAIQSFTSQETPIVRITDSDGAVRIGYSYTIGTGGPSIIALLQHTLAPMPIGRDAQAIQGRWHDMLFATHATAVGAVTSLAMAAMLEEIGTGWFEEPLPADDIGAHARLAARTSVPIAVGENLYALAQFKDYLGSGAASVVQADVARVGGITPWLKIAHLAEAHSVAICPHFLMELHVSLVCAVQNAEWLEYIPQLNTLAPDGMRIEHGRAHPSNEPGIGIGWDWQAVTRQAALPALDIR